MYRAKYLTLYYMYTEVEITHDVFVILKEDVHVPTYVSIDRYFMNRCQLTRISVFTHKIYFANNEDVRWG